MPKPLKKGYLTMDIATLITSTNTVLTPDGKVGSYFIPKAHLPEYTAAIRARKPEIVAYITAERETKARAAAERQAKIDAIPGLAALQSAMEANAQWRDDFNRAIYDDDGRVPPSHPPYDTALLLSQYPRAAAYVKAEAYTRAAHHAKAAAGKKAVERIINGEPHETVIADMESEWLKAAEQSVWNA